MKAFIVILVTLFVMLFGTFLLFSTCFLASFFQSLSQTCIQWSESAFAKDAIDKIPLYNPPNVIGLDDSAEIDYNKQYMKYIWQHFPCWSSQKGLHHNYFCCCCCWLCFRFILPSCCFKRIATQYNLRISRTMAEAEHLRSDFFSH